jgi:hypothetical protein
MELAIAFEGGVFGGLVVGDMHVARKGNPHWIVDTPARRALGLEYGNAQSFESCRLSQTVQSLGAMCGFENGGQPRRTVIPGASSRLGCWPG